MKIAMLARRPLLIFEVLVLVFLIWYFQSTKQTSSAPAPSVATSSVTNRSSAVPDSALTNVYAHNLLLRKGPGFRVYVPWLRGRMIRVSRDVNPSFDEPESFVLDIERGVIHTNVGDLTSFLNDALAKSPLKNIALSGDRDQLNLRGTLHDVVPLPIQMVATISVATANRVQLHVTKLSVLKIPVKGLLGDFHLTVSSLFNPGKIPGIEVSGNDLFLDTEKLLPPPHIRGKLTSVRIVNPDVEEIYGNAQDDVTRVAQWRNFLRLSGGTMRRESSPSGNLSTLITSAPMSASNIEQAGPAMM